MNYFNQRLQNYKWYLKEGKANTFYDPHNLKSYQEFLKSDFWKYTKIRFLRNKYSCKGCYKTLPLDVHHISYFGMFKPNLGQLLPLCRDCHFYLHTFPFNQRRKIKQINKIFLQKLVKGTAESEYKSV